MAPLARLLTLAGWCCADSGLNEHTWYYLQRGVERAGVAQDTYQLVITLRYGGALLRECGHPDDGLKLLQLGQFKLTAAASDDPRLPVLGAWLRGESALALATMGSATRRAPSWPQPATATCPTASSAPAWTS